MLLNLLVLVAVVLVVLLLYAEYSSIFALQVVAGIGALAVAIAAVIVFYLHSPQKRSGEQVSY